MAEVDTIAIEDTVHRSGLIDKKLNTNPCVFDNQSRSKQKHNA